MVLKFDMMDIVQVDPFSHGQTAKRKIPYVKKLD